MHILCDFSHILSLPEGIFLAFFMAGRLSHLFSFINSGDIFQASLQSLTIL